MNINYEKICYGCFREKDTPICPYCGFDASAEPMYSLALPLGSILNGRYLVGKPLGQGGFGITYLAFDMTLQIKVAIKEFLPTGMVSRDNDRSTVVLFSRRSSEEFTSSKEKFLDEARILARLADSVNIVKVQNYFTENNTAYFTMEFVDGISLKDLVAQQGGRLPWDLVNGYLYPIARALISVHAEDLLHRDISPDNIYITKKGVSKLLDFGAARSAAGDSRSMSIILKHGFAPEEQYRTHGKQGPWTDAYALAATYYYCLTGQLIPDSIDRLHKDDLVAPSQRGIQIPPVAEAALLKALAVNAEDRFQNMQDFMDAVTGKKPVTGYGVDKTRSAVATSASTIATAPAPTTAHTTVPATAPTVPAFIAGPSPSSPSASLSGSGRPMAAPTANTFGQSSVSATAPSAPTANTTPTKAKNKLPLIIGGAAAALVIIVAIVVLVVVNPFAGSEPSVDQPIAGNAEEVAQQTEEVEAGTDEEETTAPDVPTVNGYYYSTEGPMAIIPAEGWKIDDSVGSLMLTSPSGDAIISFFQATTMSPTTFAAQRDSMVETAAESFDALSYDSITDETRTIAGYQFYVVSFNLVLDDGIYPTQYYVTTDNVRGSIVVMVLEMPGATDADRTEMMSMIGSLLVL